jgi:cytidine deaminase
MLDGPVLAQLVTAARQAQQAAYAPYSGFPVGAAVFTAEGNISTGCNVENASFGLSLCAERSAISAAIAAGMQRGALCAIAIVAPDATPVLPCGACLQVLAEFAAADCVVISVGNDGALATHMLAELLPHAFTLPKP